MEQKEIIEEKSKKLVEWVKSEKIPDRLIGKIFSHAHLTLLMKDIHNKGIFDILDNPEAARQMQEMLDITQKRMIRD